MAMRSNRAAQQPQNQPKSNIVQMRLAPQDQIDLVELCIVLWRKIWAIILCFVVGAVIAGSYTTFFITPMYTSSATFYVLSGSTSITSIADIQLSTSLRGDFATIATTRPILEEVIDDLGLDMTTGQLKGCISVTNPTDTHFLTVTCVNSDPELACKLANAVAEATMNRIAEVMDTDRPNMVEEAIPATAPSSPNRMRNIFMGGLVGAFLAIAWFTFLFMKDDTIKSEEDVKKYLGLNTLAAIPMDKGFSSKKKA